MNFFVILFFLCSSLFAQKPELLLLNNYNEDSDVTSWYMSEKLDGVRAYWDGEKLISRSGKVFSSPSFFTKDFPKHKLDGELWSKRADFANIVSIVNRKQAHVGWKNLTYNVFEVPSADGNLTHRLKMVKTSKYLKKIQQIKIKDKKDLDKFLKSVEGKGGEGVVVRDGSLPYYTGRGNSALKMKSYIDAECEIVGYNKGRGRYEGMVGSLSCRMKNMQVIKIGSGLSEHQRAVPPDIGEIITFKYYGLTSKGNPRFPIFLRVRE
ncbi:MAG: DNA ligase [Campylobacterota bacterium]|nr:DNA ligase [Campylobacterota bacterium]